MKIKTFEVQKCKFDPVELVPIPSGWFLAGSSVTQQMSWMATLDDQAAIYGYGVSRREAVIDLLRQLDTVKLAQVVWTYFDQCTSERRFSVAEIKRYAESFLTPSNCGDDASDGGCTENKQLWTMLGNIDYSTGKGTIGDFTDKANHETSS